MTTSTTEGTIPRPLFEVNQEGWDGFYLPAGALVEFHCFCRWRATGADREAYEHRWGRDLGVWVLEPKLLKHRPSRQSWDPTRKLYLLSIAESSLRPVSALAQMVLDARDARYESWMASRRDEACKICYELLPAEGDCDNPYHAAAAEKRAFEEAFIAHVHKKLGGRRSATARRR